MYSFLLSFYLFVIAYFCKVSSRSALIIETSESFTADKDDRFTMKLKSMNKHVSTLYEFYNNIMSQEFRIDKSRIEQANGYTIIDLEFKDNKSMEVRNCADAFTDYNEELVSVYYDEELLVPREIGLQKGLD